MASRAASLRKPPPVTSPLSLPYVLDALVPALADAVTGNGPARTAE